MLPPFSFPFFAPPNACLYTNFYWSLKIPLILVFLSPSPPSLALSLCFWAEAGSQARRVTLNFSHGYILSILRFTLYNGPSSPSPAPFPRLRAGAANWTLWATAILFISLNPIDFRFSSPSPPTRALPPCPGPGRGARLEGRLLNFYHGHIFIIFNDALLF